MKVSVKKKTSNKIIIAKKPLTNLYEMNSNSNSTIPVMYDGVRLGSMISGLLNVG